MPSNIKTPNIGLNQWIGSESPKRQDFVDDNLKIDNEIQSLKDEKSDLNHTHNKSQITDFAHTHDKNDISNFAHTHSKGDITDFSHVHKKADISDFAHTHSKSEISDFPTVSSSVTSASTSTLANSNAVKTAYDKGVEALGVANTKANSSHTHTKANITDFAHTHTMGDITGLELSSSKVTRPNGSTVEKSLSDNETSILSLSKNDGNLSQLKTTDKSNLVGAINELFQNANNGKTTIANAIGTPLTPSDTFATMGTKIDTLTDTFKNNLVAKGIEVLPNDKMSSLIDKVAGIELGKKWASGTITSNIVFPNNINNWVSVKITTNWDFIPSKVILNIEGIVMGGTSTRVTRMSLSTARANSLNTYASVSKYNSTSEVNMYITIQNDGFTIHARFPFNENYFTTPISWEAYE